jgi:hypothetical protein
MDTKKEPLNCRYLYSKDCPYYEDDISFEVRNWCREKIPLGKPNTINFEDYLKAQEICSKCTKWKHDNFMGERKPA